MKIHMLLGVVLLLGASAFAAPPPGHGGRHRGGCGYHAHRGGCGYHRGGGSSGVRLAADIVGLVGTSLNVLSPRTVVVEEIPAAPAYAVPVVPAVPAYAAPAYAVPAAPVYAAPTYAVPTVPAHVPYRRVLPCRRRVEFPRVLY